MDLAGWPVSDEAGHRHRFPVGFTLAPGATVTLYTGTGDDPAAALYWGSKEAVWNNDGDVVTVRNATGAVAVEHRYRGN